MMTMLIYMILCHIYLKSFILTQEEDDKRSVCFLLLSLFTLLGPTTAVRYWAIFSKLQSDWFISLNCPAICPNRATIKIQVCENL